MTTKLFTNKAKFLMLLLSASLLCNGCSKDYLDPKQIGRFRPTPVVNVILDSLGVMEESEPTFANAEDPRPEDLLPDQKDYTFGSGDTILISIFELQVAGRDFYNRYTVKESGSISIPDIGSVQTAGMTEVELQESIRGYLMPDLIKNPSVTVRLEKSQRRIFSVNGEGFSRRSGGEFEIPRHKEFRLSRAIAMAGGTAQFNVSNIYVKREVTGNGSALIEKGPALANMRAKSNVSTAKSTSASSFRNNKLTLIEPYIRNNRSTIMTASEMMIGAEFEKEATSAKSNTGRIEWIFEDGKYVPIRVEAETQAQVEDRQTPSLKIVEPLEEVAQAETPLEQYGWEQISGGGKQMRVIKIPTKALFGGDPRYDIIIRPGDLIMVPVDMTGEFEIMGNVRYTGAISLTGRPITLKQAIALAGGLGDLAWPKKVEVIRRIGRNKEVIVMVDLDKIAMGQQPDFFIKPNDLINIGTHGSSRYLAVLRNAFRATYGFTFQYSRNYAENYFKSGPFDSINWPF
jgi:protein involved in polysaccharide export with SLBB domain